MAAKKLNACYSEDRRTLPPKAQRTCARAKNCMRVSFADFLPGLCLLNRALFSTCISINISQKLVMRKFCILFYPLLGGGGACASANQRRQSGHQLGLFSSPVPPSPAPGAPSGSRTEMRGVHCGELDKCAAPHLVSSQRDNVLGRGHGKKPGEPTPRGHSWGNKLATSIARLPAGQAWL